MKFVPNKSLTTRRKTVLVLALRARIVLTCAEGGQNKEVAAKLGLEGSRVGAAFCGAARRRATLRAPRTVEDARIEAAIVRTLESCPENAIHRSSRGMASQRPVGVDRATHLAGLRAPAAPDGDRQALHDPNFMAKVRDAVGLYVRPPELVSFYAWMRSPNPGAGPQPPCCRCVPASRPEGRMTTEDMAPHRCSPLSTLRQHEPTAKC